MAASPNMAHHEPLLTSLGYRDVMLLGTGSFGRVRLPHSYQPSDPFVHVVSCGSHSNLPPMSSQVYRAIDHLGEPVAVKLTTTPQGRRAAQREVETMAALPPHPNCLRLRTFEETETYTLICTDLAPGGDTLQLMRNRGLTPLPEADARNLFLQLIEGLQHIHSSGFLHQDIKCENLLLSGARERQLLIADFGFASKWTPGSTLTDFRGSLHYSAPEVLARTPTEGRSADVWSAGVVLYAWVTARLPFGGETEENVKAAILSSAYNLPPALSDPLRDLLQRILHPNPERRLTLPEILAHDWVRSGDVASAASSVPRQQSAVTLPRKLTSVPPMQRTNSAPQSGKPHFLRRLSRALSIHKEN